MCGRYTHKLTWQQIVNLYRLTLPEEEPPGLEPSYNVAPTNVMPIVLCVPKIRFGVDAANGKHTIATR
jgi:putative SOS response-associated peptidase YedK